MSENISGSIENGWYSGEESGEIWGIDPYGNPYQENDILWNRKRRYRWRY
ncbi:MAG: hypothetical protein MW689_001441 [Thermodesulfobacteria bacterium]|nr:hypothetical protein [Thermodesulfobacteriota bacterium]